MSRTSIDPIGAQSLLSSSDLAQLVRVHGRRLHNFIRRRVANNADVDDLVQDTCLEAVRSIHSYKGNSRPETWLFGIALNLVRGHYKRAQTRNLFVETEAEPDGQENTSEDPSDTLARHEEIARVLRIVAQLSEHTATVLMLVFDERLTYEEAARRLQIPIGTVRSRISRVRALLRSNAVSQVAPPNSDRLPT
jgi:RNA polymerase sigma factor (sigma-70 family)